MRDNMLKYQYCFGYVSLGKLCKNTVYEPAIGCRNIVTEQKLFFKSTV